MPPFESFERTGLLTFALFSGDGVALVEMPNATAAARFAEYLEAVTKR